MKTHLLILLCLLISATTFAQFAIGSRNVTLTDASRNNRSIGCEVYYPATSSGSNATVANGEFPVIVVGHGFSMGVGAYENWWSEFVPEGYIFILPTTEVGPIPFPSHPDFGEDLAFAASEVQNWGTDQGSDFFEKIADRTAVMGHSMGGGCSFLAAENNPMIDCILGLAPAETNTSAIAAAANVTAPTLVLWGTEDEVTPEAGNALGIFNAVASDCKTYVRIDEGAHCFFADYNLFCAIGEMNIGSLSREGQHEVSFALARPFFNYFLKDDCIAYDELQNEIATNANLGTNILSCPNDAPVIVENGSILESNNQGNYQWYFNGTEIPNANQQTYDYGQAGTYQVATVNVGNCPVLSNEITITLTGIVENSLRIFRITDNEVVISSSNSLNGLSVEWFDSAGRVLKSEQLNTSGNSFSLRKPAYEGLKLLRIQSDDASEVLKVY